MEMKVLLSSSGLLRKERREEGRRKVGRRASGKNSAVSLVLLRSTSLFLDDNTLENWK
jgi:hypothetical protein